MLNSHLSNAAVVIEVCAAIRQLAINYENTTKIGQANGCKTVVQALEMHMASDAALLVVMEACGAIKNLSSNNEYNKVKLGQSSACEVQ